MLNREGANWNCRDYHIFLLCYKCVKLLLSASVCLVGSLRIVQHVETIQVPTSFEKLHIKSWEQVSWIAKQFEVCMLLLKGHRRT